VTAAEGYVWGPLTPQTQGSPWTYDLGVSQGRIRPQNWTPVDGEFVFCAGSDLVPPPVFQLNFGDQITLEQSIDLTGLDLIGARLHIRQPASLPVQRELQGDPEDAQLFSLASTELSEFVGVSGNVGSLLLVPSGNLVDADLGGTVEISGSAEPSNDGQATILGVLSPSLAALDKILLDEGPTGGQRVTLLGGRFRAAIYLDDVLMQQTVEFLGRERDRKDFKLHVSKLGGMHVVRFAFELIDERQVP
jgi:hypothetical protein